MLLFLLSGTEQLQSARWGSSLYSSHPSLPFPACLQHMSPPIVAMATPPHVADRMRKKRGRGGENNAEGKGRVGEEEMEEKSRKGKGGKMEEPRVTQENKAENNIPNCSGLTLSSGSPPLITCSKSKAANAN